jgi:hypothetical protein
MSTMKVTPVAIIVLFFLSLLTWLLLSGLNLNSVRYDRELRALDDFFRFERALNRVRREISCGLGLAASEDCPDKCDHDVASCAQSVDWLSAGLRPQLGVDRKWSTGCVKLAILTHLRRRAPTQAAALATWMRNLAVLARTLAVLDPSTS